MCDMQLVKKCPLIILRQIYFILFYFARQTVKTLPKCNK